MKKISSLLKIVTAALFLTFPSLTTVLAVSPSELSVPQLYINQPPATVSAGSNFSLALRFNANGAAVNALNIAVVFPQSEVRFVSLNSSGSYFNAILPSTPAAKNGKLNFSVANLGTKQITGDVEVGKLIFKALTGGSAQVSLSNSEAANDGKLVPLDAGSASVDISGQSATNSPSITLSGINASAITTNGATINWRTNVPTTGMVDYGTGTAYGLNASDPNLSANHSVKLSAVFAGNTKIHFKVTAYGQNGNSTSSADQTFKTKGYTVQIKVKNKSGGTLSGASVSVAGSQAVKTGSNGVAVINNVPSGNQKVVINGAPPQLIAVKDLRGPAALNVQKFSLIANKKTNPWLYALACIVLIVLLLWVAMEVRAKRQKPGTGSSLEN